MKSASILERTIAPPAHRVVVGLRSFKGVEHGLQL